MLLTSFYRRCNRLHLWSAQLVRPHASVITARGPVVTRATFRLMSTTDQLYGGSMMKRPSSIALLLTCFLAFSANSLAQAQRWTEAKANAWYQAQPWPVGSNFIPSTAINELEMWQVASFDPREIDKELGWAESLGMNTMRVFLHDLLWQQDAAGFQQRIDTFLSIAARHHIRPMLVLFDSCWDPLPHLGPQHPPTPGIHNSGWVQSPGATALADPNQYPRLKSYVQGVVGAFAK